MAIADVALYNEAVSTEISRNDRNFGDNASSCRISGIEKNITLDNAEQILSASAERIEASIDASGYDRHYCSKHYVKRCKMTFGSLKVTKIIDVRRLSVYRIHCTTTSMQTSRRVRLRKLKRSEKDISLTFCPASLKNSAITMLSSFTLSRAVFSISSVFGSRFFNDGTSKRDSVCMTRQQSRQRAQTYESGTSCS